MIPARRVPILVVLGLLLTLAGCGGGSSSSAGGVGTITGRVADIAAAAAGRVAPSGPVVISVEGTSLQTVAGADGAFTLSNVPAGLHTIVARASARAIAFCARVTPDKATNVGDVALREAGQVSGLITAADTRAPLAGAGITVTEMVYTLVADSQPHPVRVARSNESGSYTVSGLPAGEYLITVQKEGYETESLLVYVSGGATTVGDVALDPAAADGRGVVQGAAYLASEDGSKQPLAGVLIRLAPGDFPEPTRPLPMAAVTPSGSSVELYAGSSRSHAWRERYTFTDDQGAYRLTGIPAGEYIAVAVRPGLDPETRPVSVPAEGAVTVDFTLRLHQPQVGTITGVVLNASTSAPIADASVSAMIARPLPFPDSPQTAGAHEPGGGGGHGFAPGGILITPDDFKLSDQTGPDGKFELKVPPGENEIYVWAAGFEVGTARVTVALNGTANVEVKLNPETIKEVTLSGQVVRASGDGQLEPAPFALVTASPPYLDHGGYAAPAMGGGRSHPVFVIETRADEQGLFKVTLRSGVYALSAYLEGWYSEPEMIDLKEDTERRIILQPLPSPSPGGPGGR